MSNALQIMQRFMNSLDNTTLSGRDALDEAVRACSGFGSMQLVIDSLVQGCASATDKTAWLQEACGINLTNEDTGAITGSDAGVGGTKTASSVVPEDNRQRQYSSLTEYTKSDWQGLQVTQPTNFNEAQTHVLSGIYTWWMGEGLKLIKESYGLSFDEAGTTVKKLTITFNAPPDGWGNTLASIYSWENYSGEATSLTLHVNMAYFSNITADDRDGKQGWNYLDRTLAHELTHAVMAANIHKFLELPRFIKEGAAELVHGIDDTRGKTIQELIQDPTALRAALNVDNTSGSTSTTYTSDAYAAGYMLLRYLAKQGVNIGEGTAAPVIQNWPSSQITYRNDYNTVNVGAGYNGLIWLNSRSGVPFASRANTVDATSADGSIALIGKGTDSSTLIGGKGANAMWGGGSSNDTMQGGSGRNVFWYANGDGSDTVTNFHGSSDTIYFYQGAFDSVTTSGNDVVFQAGNGSLRVSQGAAQRMAVRLGSQTIDCWFGRADQNNTVDYTSNINFYAGSADQTDTLRVTGSQTTFVNLQSKQDCWYLNMDVVDSSAATGSQVLVGSADRSSTLKGGSGINGMWGGGATADTLQGGSGADAFWYGWGDGQDTIVNGQRGDIVYLYNVDISQAAFSMDGSNLKLTLGGNDTLTVAGWTAASGVNTFRCADQSEYAVTSIMTVIQTK